MPEPVPLRPIDPPKVGDYWLDARLTASASGIAYLAHEDDNPNQVMVVLLSEGAAGDAAARDRFAGEVNKMHIDTVLARGGEGQDDGRLGVRYRSGADDPSIPGAWPLAGWVALAYDGSPAAIGEAERLLASVDLSTTYPLGRPTGPDYRLHWLDETQPGTWRVWPLPWPGRHDRAGWVAILVSWLLLILMAALGLLIAVLIFANAPTQAPPPPVPTQGNSSGSPSPQSGSPSPQSASPSSQSASPSSASPSSSPSSASESPSSASASPSNSASPSQSSSPSQSPSQSESPNQPSPSDTPRMRSANPSGTESGGGQPTPNKRL